MSGITLKNIKKLYPHPAKRRKGAVSQYAPTSALQITEEGVVAVQQFSLEIKDREFLVLVGPSGCGKSTVLRMIAGLEEITEGEIYIDDRLVNDLPPKDRDIAMVFQNYSLYPHMTVYENMAFALELQKLPHSIIDERVRQAAEILDIADRLDRKPRTLSGGQRQRVAIGRAIVREPRVFLMDEPLSNLDAKLRSQMRTELIKLRKRLNTTFVYVTHDQTEAMTLGDRLVVMKDGYIQQIGSPAEVYDHPANLFVAGFIGTPQMNFLDAQLSITDERYFVTPQGGVPVRLSEDMSEALRSRGSPQGRVKIGIRPDHMELAPDGTPGVISCPVIVCELLGSSLYVHGDLGGNEIISVLPTAELPEKDRDGFDIGRTLSFTFSGDHVHIFDPDTGMNLI